MRKALITGITGQDGSHLAELLLCKGYHVAGLIRHTSTDALQRIRAIRNRLQIVHGDLLDESSLFRALEDLQPDEIYNLAGMSFVPTSWNQPVVTGEFTGIGVARMLEAMRQVCPAARFYQASSSEMFGKVRETPQRETTPFHPRSPYAAAKAYGHYITMNYRESYGLFACSGILFNHEGPRRGLEFVTRKISRAAAQIKLGMIGELRLGNLDSRRDWGYAGDFVRAMWLMLQQDHPDDYVIGTGESHSVREFVEVAFDHLALDWRKYVIVDPTLYRPAEVDVLLADPGKARKALAWQPQVTFHELVKLMVDSDLNLLREQQQTNREQHVQAAKVA